MIHAAGGVVWRPIGRGELEVLLIHRPHRNDWSLPKGKIDPGETAIECALREVHEETGFACTPGPELPSTTYRDRKRRRKQVRYWSMHDPVGRFRPNDEVDEIRWVQLSEIADHLTYRRDVEIVTELGSLDVV
jgi:8-oxo-dGTP diphosphatase